MGRWRSGGRCCRLLVVALLVIFIFDLIVFNICLYYGMGLFRQVYSAFREPNLVDGITNIGVIRSAIDSLKKGGLSRLEEETLGRIFVRSHKVPPSMRTNSTGDFLSYLGIDVSHSGEVTYITKRMLSNPLESDVAPLVVDIGANDGLLSSNSYNFIQLGWNAVLVEPLRTQLEMAAVNLDRLRELGGNGAAPSVRFVQAVIGDTDGEVELAIGGDPVSMESHMVDKRHLAYPGQKVIKVKSVTVASLVRECKIPRRFGVLSIDAEGVGDKILKQFLDQGLRPAFIIYETLHLGGIPAISRAELRAFGYRYLTHRGWNHIFEYRGETTQQKNIRN